MAITEFTKPGEFLLEKKVKNQWVAWVTINTKEEFTACKSFATDTPQWFRLRRI